MITGMLHSLSPVINPSVGFLLKSCDFLGFPSPGLLILVSSFILRSEVVFSGHSAQGWVVEWGRGRRGPEDDFQGLGWCPREVLVPAQNGSWAKMPRRPHATTPGSYQAEFRVWTQELGAAASHPPWLLAHISMKKTGSCPQLSVYLEVKQCLGFIKTLAGGTSRKVVLETVRLCWAINTSPHLPSFLEALERIHITGELATVLKTPCIQHRHLLVLTTLEKQNR